MATILSAEWLMRLERLVDQAFGAGEDEDLFLVTEIYRLCKEGPQRFCDFLGAGNIALGEVEHLVECGAGASAALRLVRPLGYLMSRNPKGLVFATIVYPAVGEVSFSADSETAAICGALGSAILQAVKIDSQH